MNVWCGWVGFGWMGGWVLLMDGWVDGRTDGGIRSLNQYGSMVNLKVFIKIFVYQVLSFMNIF